MMKYLMNISLAVFFFFFIIHGMPSSANDLKPEDVFNMSIEQLMTMKVVTAGKQLEKVRDIPASVVVISRREIESYGYTRLQDILENIPGLFLIDDYGEDSAKFGVRGFWTGVANRNLIILVNGVNQIADLYSSYPLTKIAVPVETIERIEVIRGPMSVIYGSGAFYGVINIITSEKPEEAPQSQISGSIDSEGTYNTVISTSGFSQNDRIKYSIDAAIYDSKGIDVSYSELRNDEFPDGWGAALDDRTKNTLEENQKYMNFSGLFQNLTLNVTYNENEKESYSFFPAPSGGEGTLGRYTSINISGNYQKICSSLFSFNTKLGYFRNNDYYKFNLLSNDFFGTQQIDSNAFEGEIDAFVTPYEDLKITSGINIRTVLDAHSLYDLPSFGDPGLENGFEHVRGDVRTRALFTQVDYRLLSNLKFTAGIRFDQMLSYNLARTQVTVQDDIDDSGEISTEIVSNNAEGEYDWDKIETLSRFAAIYDLNRNNVLKFLYGEGLNRPSIFQNMKNTLVPGNERLKPEKIETFEINCLSSILPSLSTSVSVFRNSLKSLITRISEIDADGNYRSWNSNAGEMITNGIEATFYIEPVSNIHFEISATYQDTEDETTGYEDIDPAYSPEILGYVKASYSFSPDIIFSATGNYVDDMETFWNDAPVDPEGGDYSPVGRIGDKTDSYFNLGINSRISNIFKKGLYVNVKVSNLLDDEIRYPTFTTNDWADKGTLGYGRRFIFSGGWKF